MLGSRIWTTLHFLTTQASCSEACLPIARPAAAAAAAALLNSTPTELPPDGSRRPRGWASCTQAMPRQARHVQTVSLVQAQASQNILQAGPGPWIFSTSLWYLPSATMSFIPTRQVFTHSRACMLLTSWGPGHQVSTNKCSLFLAMEAPGGRDYTTVFMIEAGVHGRLLLAL